MEEIKAASGTSPDERSAARAGGDDGKGSLKPCEKAFHQETARFKDPDEACDDGVR